MTQSSKQRTTRNLRAYFLQFSGDIGLEFRLNKCPKETFRKGKLMYTTAIELDIDTTIRELEKTKLTNTWKSTKETEYNLVR